MRLLLRRLPVLLVLAVWACGDDPEPRTTDDAGMSDGSIRTDARMPDASERETSVTTPSDADVDAEVDADVDAEVDANVVHAF